MYNSRSSSNQLQKSLTVDYDDSSSSVVRQLNEDSKYELTSSTKLISNISIVKVTGEIGASHQPATPKIKPIIGRPIYTRSYSIGPSVNFNTSSEEARGPNGKYSKMNGHETGRLFERLRRFSENHIFHSKQNLTANNTANNGANAATNNGNLVDLANTATTISIRRHTRGRFKHGRTARVLGLTTLGFAITWIPYWLYLYKITYMKVLPDVRVTEVTLVDCLLIKYVKNSYYLNYILNPIFYSFVNQRFRRIFLNLFKKVLKFVSSHLFYCCCCCCCCCANKLGLFRNKTFNFFNAQTNASSNFYCSSQSFSSNLNKRTHQQNMQQRRSRMNSVRSEAMNSSLNSSTSSSNNNNNNNQHNCGHGDHQKRHGRFPPFRANLNQFFSKKISSCCSKFYADDSECSLG